jgi:hypothetical protein
MTRPTLSLVASDDERVGGIANALKNAPGRVSWQCIARIAAGARYAP